jgi:hypothetical protein
MAIIAGDYTRCKVPGIRFSCLILENLAGVEEKTATEDDSVAAKKALAEFT